MHTTPAMVKAERRAVAGTRKATPRTPPTRGTRGALTAGTARSAQALEVLCALVKEVGRWVTGRELGAAWPRILNSPLPADVKGRWSRAFEHALKDGRVVTRRDGMQQVYAPSTCASDLEANPGSDLVRVQTAIARVVARVGGAVPVEAIELEIDGDESLAMHTGTCIASRVIRLAEQGRIQRLHAPGSTAGRWYYAPNGGTASVATETELVMDRRMRAIRALWRLSKGRPFTTRAVSAYAKDRNTFMIAEDTQHGWTNALQHLARQGFLTGLDVSGSDWHVRWALTKEWEVLSPSEQRVRLADPYGRDLCEAVVTSTPTPGAQTLELNHGAGERVSTDAHPSAAQPAMGRLASPRAPHLPGIRIDVGKVSRARDVAALVAMAQARWAARAQQHGDPTLRAYSAERAVTLEEVAEERAANPLLLPEKQPLLAALHEATRVREAMRAAAVTHMGTVRNTSYFAVRATQATRSFVEVHRALADANLPWLYRVLSELHTDRGYSDGGVIPVPIALLLARAADIQAEADEIAKRLSEALPPAPLTYDERDEAQRALHALQSIAADAGAMTQEAQYEMPRTAAGAHRPPAEMWLDIAVAERQFRGLLPHKMGNPRALWARIVNAVRVLRTPDTSAVPSNGPGPVARRRGRQVSNYLDRVGFSLWVARRIGGPLVSGVAAQALAVIGESRRVNLVIECLNDPAQRPAHTGLCAALGFFDDDVARDALTAYLENAVADASARRASNPTSVGAGAVGASNIRAATGERSDAPDEPWDAPVWRRAPVELEVSLPITSGNAVATAVLGLGRTPCGGLANTLLGRERAALEAVRDQAAIPFAQDAARQVLRGWDSNWTREQWLAI